MLTHETRDNFYKALEEMEKPGGCFLGVDLEAEDFVLELDYPRSEFISDIEQCVANLEPDEKTNVTSFFGFIIEHYDNITTILGYPSVTNIQRESRYPFSKVYFCVSRFMEENKIIVRDNPELSKCLNPIIAAFPEFLTMVGKVQHHTHSYTVDIHTLKVLQGVLSNPHFSKLPEEDKRALEIAVLMHDITKKEGEIDKSHPACSARDTSFILNKTYLTDTQKENVCTIIRNHDWLERYNKGLATAEELAEALRSGNNFVMVSMLAEADLKGVQRSGVFYQKYAQVLNRGYEEINDIINTKFRG